jgi:hypothetical protein
MSKREENAMKCGRCGQWIPLSQWEYAPPRMMHGGCPALPAKTQEAPRGIVLIRRGGAVRRTQ